MEKLESHHIRKIFHILSCIIGGVGYTKSNGHIIMYLSRAMKNIEFQIWWKKNSVLVYVNVDEPNWSASNFGI